jgi:hypothetical protein
MVFLLSVAIAQPTNESFAEDPMKESPGGASRRTRTGEFDVGNGADSAMFCGGGIPSRHFRI